MIRTVKGKDVPPRRGRTIEPLLRKVQRVVEKYDLLQFIFKTPRGYEGKNTFLELENRQGGQIGKYGLPALFFPLRIAPPRWMTILKWVRYSIAGAAVLATMASEPLARYFLIGADVVRGLALLLLVSTTQRWDEFVGSFVKEAKAIKVGSQD
ncbi:MAG: hypothetical protein ACM3TN_10125 [Alphaproteobacteria bacterium]